MAGERVKAEGDIRDLYARYRFGDHNLTVFHLKEKVFNKEEVWFEGHTNWTFEDCDFSKKFHFGVEGSKLSEDTRGSDENPEPHPGWGNNVLHFVDCTFNKFFEVQDNCIAVFKDCVFEPEVGEDEEGLHPFLVAKDTKAEFLDCTFRCDIEIENGCDVKFTNCTFEKCNKNYMKITSDCSVHVVNGATVDPATEGFWCSASGSEVSFRNVGGIFLANDGPAFQASGGSKMTLAGIGGMKGDAPAAITVTGASRLEMRDCGEIKSDNGQGVVVSGGSELFVKGLALIKSGDIALKISGASNVRMIDVYNEIIGEGHPAVECTGSSTVSFALVNRIKSDGKEALKIVESNCNCNNVNVITAAWNPACLFKGVGSGISYIRNTDLIESGAGDAVRVEDGHRTHMYNVKEIKATENAMSVKSGGVLEDFTGEKREGEKNGLNIESDGLYRADTISEYIKGIENGIIVNDGAYDIRKVTKIEGAEKGMTVTKGRGILREVDEIVGQADDAVTISDSSGPAEWQEVIKIHSPAKKALVMSGDVGNIRIMDVTEILAPADIALSTTISGNAVYLHRISKIESNADIAWSMALSGGILQAKEITEIKSTAAVAISGSIDAQSLFEGIDLPLIESTAADAISLAVNGELRLKNITDIKSTPAKAMNVSIAGGGLLQAYDLSLLDAPADDALSLSISLGTAIFNTVTDIKSGGGNGITLNLSSGCEAKFLNCANITGGGGSGIAGTNKGSVSVYGGSTIDGSSGSGINLAGASGAMLLLDNLASITGSVNGVNVAKCSLRAINVASISGEKVGIAASNTEGFVVHLQDLPSVGGATGLSITNPYKTIVVNVTAEGKADFVSCNSLHVSTLAVQDDGSLTSCFGQLKLVEFEAAVSIVTSVLETYSCTFSDTVTSTDSVLKTHKDTLDVVTVTGGSIWVFGSTIADLTLATAASLIALSGAIGALAGEGSAILLESGIVPAIASEVTNQITLAGTALSIAASAGFCHELLDSGVTWRGATVSINDTAPVINHN